MTGKPTVTREHAELLAERSGLTLDSFFVHDEGRRLQTSQAMKALLDQAAAAGGEA